MISFAIGRLNGLPPDGVISYSLVPLMIINATKSKYFKKCQILFDAYAQVSEDTESSNNISDRKTDNIYLGLSVNLLGEYKFLSIQTSQKMTQCTFTEIRIP